MSANLPANNGNVLPEPYSGKFKGCFAYLTIKDRLPVILTKVIDCLCREKHIIYAQYGEVAQMETKEIIGRLSQLQSEMVTNKPLRPLITEESDVVLWNEYLKNEMETHEITPSWFDSAWLYIECYLYRRIKESFELSTLLKLYDPFRQQKEDAYRLSVDSVISLAKDLQLAILDIENLNDERKIADHFASFLEVSLWGNKCDLSISAGKENVPLVNPIAQLSDLKRKILVNDSDLVLELLLEANKKSPSEVRIDFVLDNAGFELFCDLCFVHFLQSVKLVSKVHLYVKTMPWYVSDTVEQDLKWLLETLSNSDEDILAHYGKEWTERLGKKQWVVENEPFWTLPYDYSEMKAVDSQLYSKLSQSDLIIFKGDLNYRKLTLDRMWDETTPFVTALNGFLPSSLVSLRTVKANVIVGLEAGTSERLNKISQDWKFTGEYSTIQCALKR